MGRRYKDVRPHKAPQVRSRDEENYRAHDGFLLVGRVLTAGKPSAAPHIYPQLSSAQRFHLLGVTSVDRK